MLFSDGSGKAERAVPLPKHDADVVRPFCRQIVNQAVDPAVTCRYLGLAVNGQAITPAQNKAHHTSTGCMRSRGP
jgi:hypothetical protein